MNPNLQPKTNTTDNTNTIRPVRSNLATPVGSYGTLASNTVATVVLTGDAVNVDVMNRSGAAEIFFTVDGSTPTVAGAGTLEVPAVAGATKTVQVPGTQTGVSVKLISSGTPTYSVVSNY